MRLLIPFLFAFFLVALTPLAVRADDTARLASAKTYVDKVAGDALDTIKQTRDKKITPDNAKLQFRRILNNAFDLNTISRFTLGRYWRVATPKEQQEFTRLLQTVILNKYADRLLEFSGDAYTIDGARVLNARDVVVDSTILPKDKPPVNFAWRLRKTGASFRIIDLAVEGVSMSVTHRSDFASEIEANGGKVQALIDALQDKEKNQK